MTELKPRLTEAAASQHCLKTFCFIHIHQYMYNNKYYSDNRCRITYELVLYYIFYHGKILVKNVIEKKSFIKLTTWCVVTTIARFAPQSSFYLKPANRLLVM